MLAYRLGDFGFFGCYMFCRRRLSRRLLTEHLCEQRLEDTGFLYLFVCCLRGCPNTCFELLRVSTKFPCFFVTCNSFSFVFSGFHSFPGCFERNSRFFGHFGRAGDLGGVGAVDFKRNFGPPLLLVAKCIKKESEQNPE